MKLGSLFTGYGGLCHLAVAPYFGAQTVWTSDIDQGACKIIAHRMPDIPNLGDITAVDWSAVEPVDILTGGFPCQDLSHAGKRAGLKPGTRSGLWSHMAYAISQLRPRYVVAENVRGLLSARAHSDLEPCPWCVGSADGEPDLRALGAVLGDLAELGFDARWVGLRAADVGAPHGRFRVFIFAPASDSDRGHRNGRTAAGQQGQTRSPARPSADANGRRREVGSKLDGYPSHDPADRHPPGQHTDGHPRPAWGGYGPAIRRWESRLGRVAPAPTETSAKGNQRLSPKFVEWMQGVPEGWVCDVPGLTRNEALKALGNGVVPAQATAALRLLTATEVAA